MVLFAKIKKAHQKEYISFGALVVQEFEENQQPRRKRRGTVLNVSHCVFYKVVAVGFNTLCYDAERRGIKPSARIKIVLFERKFS